MLSNYHLSKLAFLQKTPEAKLVLIGDSITDYWDYQGASVRDSILQRYTPINYGISGDQTCNVFQRLCEGESSFRALSPKLCVLMIGINDLYAQIPVESVVTNQTSILRYIHDLMPHARIMVMAVLHPTDGSGMDAQIRSVNQKLKSFCDTLPYVHFVDMNVPFSKDSAINASFYVDNLHLSVKGFNVWGDLIAKEMESLQ